MAAPIGNNNAKKLKTIEQKEKVYKSYCQHLSLGKCQNSWYYEDDGLTLTSETLEKYIKEDVDFDTIHKDIAKAKGLAIWEDVLAKGAKCERDINTAAMQMIMRNMYSWDKEDKDNSQDKTINISRSCTCNNKC